MSTARITEILQNVKFQDWTFLVGKDGDRPYLQVQFLAPCAKGGEVQVWNGRKFPLSPHMTKSEIVSTAFKAVLTAVEHEARENFKYKGRAIFGPHIDVEALHFVANTEDVRASSRDDRDQEHRHRPLPDQTSFGPRGSLGEGWISTTDQAVEAEEREIPSVRRAS